MSECLNCGKQIEAYTGRRAKKYCSSACKQAYFQKNKKKEPKYVLLTTYKDEIEKRDARIKLLEAQISAQSENKAKYQNNLKEAKTWTSVPADAVFVLNSKPVRLPNEDALDYAGRVNEWKKSLK